MTKKFISRQTDLPRQPAKSPFSPRPFSPAVQAKAQDNPTAAPLVEHSPQNSNLLSRLTHSEPVSESQQIGSEVGREGPGNQHKIQRKRQDNLAQVSAVPPTPPSTSRFPIQAKLTVGDVGDKHEQETHRVARQMANRIQAPQANLQSSDSNPIQRKISSEKTAEPIQAKGDKPANQTGLPDNLKAEIENLSGYSLDDVRVHYNSPKPAQLQALAYTQGTEIHVAPGQEKHLPHEAWHVVQQKQGRVKPTIQMKGTQINDDQGLEREADLMGQKAKISGDSKDRQTQVQSENKRGPIGLPDNLKSCQLMGNYFKNNLPIQLVKEYKHLVIDKQDVGLDALRESLNENGLQTAENRNISLSEGSEKLGHHQHVFMWDSSKKGIQGSIGIESQGEVVKVRIRMQGLSEPTWYSRGTLKGDNMGPLGGKSTTGAWAYEGDIPRKYLFIDGMDSVSQPGFESWYEGKGWPDDHAELALRRYGYTEIL
ncbi:DUF4157 domain-containing protein [Laspinema sp. A4]|uniref:eCIS core domain-containing protein n=1 Tax=Laspinema sp. D2d TaxID=2953686 RepID=UPI0021BB39C7|nr:DUF4157 domain-containing protein [Laspinema sp. D2d]MCT7984920.1 DUF4157 domain-containing protein [Laspinema sp. D2d]